MAADILNTSSIIMCPHGGQAVLFTSNARVLAGAAPALLESDIHPVVGCPFSVGPKYSPCVRIEWLAGAGSVSVGGTPVLLQTSVGTCMSAEGAPQGTAVIANTQVRASGR
jgi:hypothetical protein